MFGGGSRGQSELSPHLLRVKVKATEPYWCGENTHKRGWGLKSTFNLRVGRGQSGKSPVFRPRMKAEPSPSFLAIDNNLRQ